MLCHRRASTRNCSGGELLGRVEEHVFLVVEDRFAVADHARQDRSTRRREVTRRERLRGAGCARTMRAVRNRSLASRHVSAACSVSHTMGLAAPSSAHAPAASHSPRERNVSASTRSRTPKSCSRWAERAALVQPSRTSAASASAAASSPATGSWVEGNMCSILHIP